MVTFKSPAGRRPRVEEEDDEDENEVFDEQNYIHALGADNTEGEWDTWNIQMYMLDGSLIFL